MKTVIVCLFIFLAVVCLALGVLACADPEGRGGVYLLKFWGAGIVCGALAFAADRWLP